VTITLPVAGPVSPLLSIPGLKVPAFASIPEYHDTLGDEAIDFNREVCGLYPDPQQELAINIIFARDKRGRSAAFSATLIAARQMLKTGVFKMVVLPWLYLFEEPMITWSAHRAETSFAAQEDLEKIIDASDTLRRATRRFVHGNGAEAIETVSRCKVSFRTRTKTGGKGLSANKVILDEAFALQPLHMGALLPTLTAMPDPQVLYGSSAAMEDSVVLHEKIESGRPGTERDWGTDQPLHRLVTGPMAAAYLEWCAPPPEIACDAGTACTHARTAAGCGCDKAEWLLRANPAVGPAELIGTRGGPRSTMDYLIAERKELPALEYARERMGWHEKARAGASPIPMTMWYGPCSDRESTPAAGSALALAIAVAKDKSMAAIALAGWRPDGLPHGELVEHLPGTGWLMDRLLGIVGRRKPCCVVMDPRGPAGGFEKALRLNGFRTVPKTPSNAWMVDRPPPVAEGNHVLMVVSSVEDAQACNMLADRVIEGTFRHPDQGPLNIAVRDARSRPVGQSWAWDEDTGKDVTPVKAVTLAQIGLATYGAKSTLTPFAMF
jgi:hypothetical protein